MNGDGRPDIVLDSDHGSVSVLVNDVTGNFAGPVTTIDQTPPTATISAEPPSLSLDATASFAFSGSDPTAGGVSSGVNHLEVSLDGAPFAAAVSPVNLTGLAPGVHTFQVRAVDNVGNVGTATSDSWTIDPTAAPSVVSIGTGAASPTNASSVVYAVRFNGAVTGVAAGDFLPILTGTLTAAAPVVSGSGSLYSVTVSGILGDGTLALMLKDDDSIDAIVNGLPLGGVGVDNGDCLSDSTAFDHTGPTVAFLSGPPSTTASTSATFVFTGADPVVGGVSAGFDHFEYSIDGGALFRRGQRAR